MKRLSLLFSLLLLCVGVAVADDETTTSSDLQLDGTTQYVMKLVSYGTASTTPSTDTYMGLGYPGSLERIMGQSLPNSNEATKWDNLRITLNLVSGTTDHVQIKVNNKYMPSFTNGSGGFSPTTPVGDNQFELVTVDGGYKLRGYKDATAGLYVAYSTSNDNNKNAFIVTSNASEAAVVKFEKLADITYTDNTTNRIVKNTKIVSVGTTENLEADFCSDFNPTSLTYTATDNTYSVTYTSSFPFKEGKFYKLKLREFGENDKEALNVKDENQKYIYRSVTWNGTSNRINTRNAVCENNTGFWYFKFVEGSINQVNLYSVCGSSKGVRIDETANDARAFTSAKPTNFICKKGNTGSNYSQGFRLSATTNNRANLNDISGELGYWLPNNDNSTTDEGSTFLAYEVENTPTTINTIVATNTTTNEVITIENIENFYWNDGSVIPHNSFISIEETPTVNEHTLSFNYTSTAPYDLSGTTDDSKHWQVIRTRKDYAHYLRTNGTNTQARNNTIDKSSISTIRSFSETNTNLWAIVPADGNFDVFYLYNKATGNKKAFLSSEAHGTIATMQDNGTPFYLTQQPTFSGITGGFTIQPNNNNNHAIGDHSGNLSYWANRGSSELNDEGSIFRVDLVSDCNTLVQNIASQYLGGFSTTALTQLSATKDACRFFAKYDEIINANDESNYVAPSTTKYYRIQANRYSTPVYMSFDNATANKEGEVQLGYGNTPDERKLGFSQTASTNNLVCLENVANEEGKYYIKDANSGFYYGAKSDNGNLYLVKNSEYAGKYSITYSLNGNVAQVGLKENKASDITSQYLNCCGSDANAAIGDNNYVKFTSPYNNNATTGTTATVDAGCVYQIAEVSTYPLTISAAKYASLCLPFSVTLPEGLTAYKVTSVTNGTDNREMDLTAINGAIPANEPVIIGATAAGSFNLTINTDNNATQSTDNWLTGATVKRTGIDEDYFALGYKALNSDDADTKTVGFFRVTTANMPANKAYLLKSRIQESAANPAMVLMFNFGNVTTNINNAKTNEVEGSNTYYDLNGRRVLYPTHGVYVKGNGQKVFIK